MIRPTVFIGLGSTGGRMIEAVQHELTAFCGHPTLFGVCAGLAIDCDRTSLSNLTLRGDSFTSRMIGVESVAEAVRTLSDSDWVPIEAIESGGTLDGTRGCRALGRLSFQSRFAEVQADLSRIRDSWAPKEGSADLLTAAEGILRTQWGETSDGGPWIATDQGVRVFVLASLCGGTGGGALGEVLGLAHAIFGTAEVIGVFLVAPPEPPGSPGSSSDLTELGRNSIAAMQDVQARWLPAGLLTRVFLGSPSLTGDSPQPLGTAVRFASRRAARLAVRLATVFDMPRSTSFTVAGAVTWGFGIGGIYYPRAEIVGLAREAQLAFLIEEWTRDLSGEVPPRDVTVIAAFERICSLVIRGSDGILGVLQEDPVVAAFDDAAWKRLQSTLRRCPIRRLMRDAVISWCYHLLKRHLNFAVVLRHLDALERYATENIQALWGPPGSANVREILRTMARGRTHSFLITLDSSVAEENRFMAGRVLMFGYAPDLLKAISDAKSGTLRILQRLKGFAKARGAYREQYLEILQDPWRVFVFQGEDASADVAELVRETQIDFAPTRYEDELSVWYDIHGVSDGVDAEDEVKGSSNLVRMMNRVVHAIEDSLAQVERNALQPRWGRVDCSRLSLDRIEAGTLRTRIDVPFDRDPLARPPDILWMVHGPSRGTVPLPNGAARYRTPIGAERYQSRSGLSDAVEFLAFRLGYEVELLAIVGDGVQAGAIDSRREVLRRPYDAMVPDRNSLADRLSHLMFLAVNWQVQPGAVLVPQGADRLLGGIVSFAVDRIVVSDLPVEVPESGYSGFQGLFQTIHASLDHLSASGLAALQRRVGLLLQRLRSMEAPAGPIAERIHRLMVGATETELSEFGVDYAKYAGIETTQWKPAEVSRVFLNRANL